MVVRRDKNHHKKSESRSLSLILVGLVWGIGCFQAGRMQPYLAPTAGSSNRQLNTVLEDLPKMTLLKVHQETKSSWDALQPLQHSPEPVEVVPGISTDAYNPFHHYLVQLSQTKHFPDLPLWNTWIHSLEAYHNHFARFRGTDVVVMEVGVQSGGKIALLKDYLGPNMTYVGIDINPSTRMFASHGVHIEIGDAADRTFWAQLKLKYPRVDIFLDDGGHTMTQQRTALEVMLPHVQANGVYLCEDLSTSWARRGPFGGVPNADFGDERFRETTMVGLVHYTLDWLNNGWIAGGVMKDQQLPATHYADYPWWRVIPDEVKHIHYYNQLVVYEKGRTFRATNAQTTGRAIPTTDSGTRTPVDWSTMMANIQSFTNSTWNY